MRAMKKNNKAVRVARECQGYGPVRGSGKAFLRKDLCTVQIGGDKHSRQREQAQQMICGGMFDVAEEKRGALCAQSGVGTRGRMDGGRSIGPCEPWRRLCP